MKIEFELEEDNKEDLSEEDIRECIVDAICEGFRIPEEAIGNLVISE
jgi:hypothetical protein